MNPTKLFLFTVTLFLSAAAFAAPKSVHLEGTMTFDFDGQAIPTQLDLTLRKEKSDSLSYNAILTYAEKHKTRTEKLRIDLDQEHQKTSGSVYMGFERIEIAGDLLALTPGAATSLHLTEYRQVPDECSGIGNTRICYPMPDRVTGEGTLDLTVISAE